RAGDERLYRAALFVTARAESDVEQHVQPVYSRWRDAAPPIVTTILASPGQIELHLTTRDRDGAAAERRLRGAVAQLTSILGRDGHDRRRRPRSRGVRAHVSVARGPRAGEMERRADGARSRAAIARRLIVCPRGSTIERAGRAPVSRRRQRSGHH